MIQNVATPQNWGEKKKKNLYSNNNNNNNNKTCEKFNLIYNIVVCATGQSVNMIMYLIEVRRKTLT
jgi:hypothetical protein